MIAMTIARSRRANDPLDGSRDPARGRSRPRPGASLRRVARGLARRARRRLRRRASPRARTRCARPATSPRPAGRRLAASACRCRRLGPAQAATTGCAAPWLSPRRSATPSPASGFSSGRRPKGSRSAIAPIPPPAGPAVNADSPGVQVAPARYCARCPTPTPPTLDDVRRAAARLDGVAHRTPVLTSSTLDALVGAEVLLKAEGLQRGGAFKFRGAYNAISSLMRTRSPRGVLAASSGNHAQAVALAARLCGTSATILMPRDAPPSKRAATEGYGARVIGYDRYGEDREALLAALAAERGLHVVHPYDDPLVIAGAGTTALELLEDAGELDLLLVPVGGGGLISGCATVVKALSPLHARRRRRAAGLRRRRALEGERAPRARRRRQDDRRRPAARDARRASRGRSSTRSSTTSSRSPTSRSSRRCGCSSSA